MGKGKHYSQKIELSPISRYLLYLPAGYDEDADRTWPLILFLHGAGERGENLDMLKIYGPPKAAEEDDNFPFIIVSPQCPRGTWWRVDELEQLLQKVLYELNVDISRIYLTGLSMGGFGAWRMAAKYPQYFAAIVPVCGGGDPEQVEQLKEIPVWAFHGAKDTIVPLHKSEQMVYALRDCGGNVKFTVYPDVAHDSWVQAYHDKSLYKWLLSQKKEQKWQREFNDFAAEDKNLSINRYSRPTLLIGSSSIQMWESVSSVSKSKEHIVLNRGLTGSELSDILENYEHLVWKYLPAKILLNAGVVDLVNGKSPERVAADVKELHYRVWRDLQDTELIFIPNMPSIDEPELNEKIEEVNKLVKEYLLNQPNSLYLDVYERMIGANGKAKKELFQEDKLHLNTNGYAIWNEAIAPLI